MELGHTITTLARRIQRETRDSHPRETLYFDNTGYVILRVLGPEGPWPTSPLPDVFLSVTGPTTQRQVQAKIDALTLAKEQGLTGDDLYVKAHDLLYEWECEQDKRQDRNA